MTEKLYIRVKKDGFIYDYDERLAKNPACEVVTEKDVYPERFLTPEVAIKIAEITRPKRGRKARKPLDVTTDISTQPVYTHPELAAEAARGLPE